ncbi:MAG: hypothetical protein M3P40_05465 [Actinomycetota bacterium]|nr:hypothetical protein [Actinomycetota bacterium]
MTFDALKPIILAVKEADLADVPLDLEALANDLDTPLEVIRARVERLQQWGLIDAREDEVACAFTAAHQYLVLGGGVPEDVLNFLPGPIGNLFTREALLTAGTVLVDEFRASILDGDAVGHARQLLPKGRGRSLHDRRVARN